MLSRRAVSDGDSYVRFPNSLSNEFHSRVGGFRRKAQSQCRPAAQNAQISVPLRERSL